MMRLIAVVILVVLVSLFASMALAMFLPLGDVNRMFVAGLSVPLLIPVLLVLLALSDRPKWVVAGYSGALPVLAAAVLLRFFAV